MKVIKKNQNLRVVLINALSALTLIFSSFSCSDDYDYKIMTLKVGTQKVKYEIPFGGSTVMGYAVTDSDNNKFAINYIHDFEDKYEEGYEYVIKVKAISSKKYIGEDVLSPSYYLIKIISKVKV